MKKYALPMLFVFLGTLVACEAEDKVGNGPSSTSDGNGTASDFDTISENTPVDTDTNVTPTFDSQDDTNGNQTSDGPIEPECTCDATGTNLDAMACAIDLCDPATVLSNSYASPSKATTNGSYAAVPHFGNTNNDLAPLYGGSYALMATGSATGKDHNQSMGGNAVNDTFAKDKSSVYDVMEWSLRLKAPKNAHGIQIHYVFFSEEYDEYIGKEFNDKFYIFLEAPSTNGGKRTVINFTECRNPAKYSDFECDASAMACEDGQKYCYIAINTALSECCWYDGCPDGKATTDISGTGFSCGTKAQEVSCVFGSCDPTVDAYRWGSSTGWLVTEWPVEPEEEFNVIFHIHDTADHNFDSEVILDKFLFVGKAEAGTKPI